MDLPANTSLTRCPVVYDLHGLLAVDKPEGVLSHPNPGPGSGKARAAFEGPYDFQDRSFRTPQGTIWLIHRLDQDTSGVLLAARTKETALKCRIIFEDGGIEKHYAALVAGQVTPPKGRWYDHLAVSRKGTKVRARVTGGDPNAKLKYEVARFYPRRRVSLLRIELMTGKTHQIRVQAAYRRYPVLGDEIYGNFALNRSLRKEIGLRRLFLHASAVSLKHPATGERVRIEAALPEKMRAVLEALDRQGKKG